MSNILSPHIIINGEIFTEILDKDVSGVKPGQYMNKDGIIYTPNGYHNMKFRYPVYEPNRYVRVKVYLIDGSIYQANYHRLKMTMFNPTNNMNNLVINHIDGNKHKNDMNNLEWCTIAENNIHAFKTGLAPINENHHEAKLTNNQVREICMELEKPKQYGTISNLAKKYNISDSVIRSIAQGKLWQNISKDYNIDYSEKGVDSILTENQVIEICEDLSKHKYHGQYTSLAKKYNVSPSTIKQIAYRNSWKHISDKYDF